MAAYSSGDYGLDLDVKSSISAEVYILADVLVQLDYIGGPKVGLRPFIEFGAEANYAGIR